MQNRAKLFQQIGYDSYLGKYHFQAPKNRIGFTYLEKKWFKDGWTRAELDHFKQKNQEFDLIFHHPTPLCYPR